MKLLINIAVTVVTMFGLYRLCQWLITGVSADFGNGVFVGAMFIVFLFAAVEKFAPDSFYWRGSDNYWRGRRPRDGEFD